MPNPNRKNGFTTVELMVVIAIMGILFALALPAVQEFLAAARVRGAASDLYGSMLMARSEAVKRNANVTVAPQGAWDGWTVTFGTTNVDVKDSVPGVSISLLQTNDGTTWSALAGNIVFLPSGRVSTASAALAIVLVSSAYPTLIRCVRLAPNGRPSVLTDTDGDPTNACN